METWIHEARTSKKICYTLKLGVLSFWELLVCVHHKQYKNTSQQFFLAIRVTETTYFAKQTQPCTETYSEPCQTSKMGHSVDTVNG